MWTYTLDNANAAVQALNDGETLTDTFTVADRGRHPQTVTITITGSNDAAVITGDTTGAVTEAGGADAGTPTATGDLLRPTSTTLPRLQAVAPGASTRNGYGTYAVTAAGCGPTRSTTTNATVRR